MASEHVVPSGPYLLRINAPSCIGYVRIVPGADIALWWPRGIAARSFGTDNERRRPYEPIRSCDIA